VVEFCRRYLPETEKDFEGIAGSLAQKIYSVIVTQTVIENYAGYGFYSLADYVHLIVKRRYSRKQER
jgi:hypothetical protein